LAFLQKAVGEPVQLNASQLQILSAVVRAGARTEQTNRPVSSRVLALRLGVTTSSVRDDGRVLSRRGLISVIANPADRRHRLFVATDEGRALMDDLAPLIAGANNLAFAALRPADAQRFARIAGDLAQGAAAARDMLAQRLGKPVRRTRRLECKKPALRDLRAQLRRLGGN